MWSHISTARLSTSPIGSSPEIIFWNSVFCGNHLMSGFETQLEVEHFCIYHQKQVTGSTQCSQRLTPMYRNPGRLFPNFYCFAKVTHGKHNPESWMWFHPAPISQCHLPHGFNSRTSFLLTVPLKEQVLIPLKEQVFSWFFLSSGGWEVRRVGKSRDKMLSLLSLSQSAVAAT